MIMLTLIILLSACGTPTPAVAPVIEATKPAPQTLTVFAAASLTGAFGEIGKGFEAANPNITVKFNFGGSQTLRTQIEQGAPADIFISAAKKQMDTLDQKGALVPGTRTNLANNKLVLIVPNGSRAVTSFMSLKKPEIKRIAIGEPRSVPAGQYVPATNYADQITVKVTY